MRWVAAFTVVFYATMRGADLDAVVAYLRSLKAAGGAVKQPHAHLL